MTKRIERINQLIKKDLSQIILREVDFPAHILVTLTRVDTSPNLIESKVFLSVMPEGQTARILNILNYQIYHLQQFLNKRLKMRPIPKIRFYQEKETQKAGRIEEILEKIKRDCKNKENV
jgi:ribosome-binding factor A